MAKKKTPKKKTADAATTFPHTAANHRRGLKPGEWWDMNDPDGGEARVRCGLCGTTQTIDRMATRLVCPGLGCDFDGPIILEGV